MVNYMPQRLHHLERNPVPTEQDRWAPGPVWTLRRREKSLDPDRIQATDNSACTVQNYLIKHKVEVVSVQATKACRAAEVPLHSFSTSELDQGE